jgi:RNA polymerase sigma-32 factor
MKKDKSLQQVKSEGGRRDAPRRSAAKGAGKDPESAQPEVVEAELVADEPGLEEAVTPEDALGEVIEVAPLETTDIETTDIDTGDLIEEEGGGAELVLDADEAEPTHEPAAGLKARGARAKGADSQESLAPTQFDPLTAYLREIRAYPPLSREEEHELGVRYLRDKDVEAAYRLVTSNLWLVVKIARDYEKAARGLLDLVQEGNIGLMEAVKNFDPYRGVRFPSYAVWWIKAYMVRYLIANWRMVKIGTTQAQRKLFFNLKKEKDRLEREGFVAAPKLLAEKLNVKESEVVEMQQRLGSSDVSVDAPLQGAESDATLLGVLPSPESSAEDLIDKRRSQALLKQGLEDFAATLKDKERIIFNERMLGEEKATLQEISEKVGVSRERVRQIENRLREKLKTFLEEQLGSALESLEL